MNEGRPGGRSLVKRFSNASQAPNLIGGQQSVMGGMGQHFGPFSVVIAAAANVGVLEGGGFFSTFQEGSVEAGLQDRPDGGRRLRKHGRARMVTPRWQAASTRCGP